MHPHKKTPFYLTLLVGAMSLFTVVFYFNQNPRASAEFIGPTNNIGQGGGLIAFDPIDKKLKINSQLTVNGNINFNKSAKGINGGMFCDQIITCAFKEINGQRIYENYTDPCLAIDRGASIDSALGISCVAPLGLCGSLPSNGLISCWSFEESGGLTIRDAVRDRANGLIKNNVNRVPGKSTKFGQAVSFSPAAPGYIEILDSLDLKEFTFSLWVKVNSGTISGSENRNVIVRTDGDPHYGSPYNGPIYDYSQQIRFAGAGTGVTPQFQYYNNSPQRLVGSPMAVNDSNQWYHVVAIGRSNSVTPASNDGFMQLYINGQPGSSGQLDELWEGGDRYQIGVETGSISGSYPKYFDGFIDEVALWNRVLTPEEIQQIYQLGL